MIKVILFVLIAIIFLPFAAYQSYDLIVNWMPGKHFLSALLFHVMSSIAVIFNACMAISGYKWEKKGEARMKEWENKWEENKAKRKAEHEAAGIQYGKELSLMEKLNKIIDKELPIFKESANIFSKTMTESLGYLRDKIESNELQHEIEEVKFDLEDFVRTRIINKSDYHFKSEFLGTSAFFDGLNKSTGELRSNQ